MRPCEHSDSYKQRITDLRQPLEVMDKPITDIRVVLILIRRLPAEYACLEQVYPLKDRIILGYIVETL